MNIPVFHDDQHGTAIISGAALLNALRDRRQAHRRGQGGVQRRRRRAASPAPSFYVRLGVQAREHHHVRHQGRHLQGPHRGHEPVQGAASPRDTDARTLAEAMRGADVFVGLSGARLRHARRWCAAWRDDPIIFAMANPDPEITYDDGDGRAPRRHHGHRPLRLSRTR